MIATVNKSPFRFVRYAAFLLWHEFVQGNAAQRRRFISRLTSRLFQKVGLYCLIDGLCLAIRHGAAFFQSQEQRELVQKYGRWIGAVSRLENRNELMDWLTDRTHPHIVVIGMGSVGDVLQITPVLRALKERLPRARICVLHRSPAAKLVLMNNPHVDTVAFADFHQFAAITKAVKVEGAADLAVEIRSMSFVLTYSPAPQALRHPDFNAALPESFFKTADVVRQRWATPRGYQKPDGKFTWPEQWQHISYLDALGMMGNLPINSHSNLDFYPDAEGGMLPQMPEGNSIITVQTGVDADVMNWSQATGQRPTKLLPPETWKQIVQQLAAQKFTIVQLGTKDDVAIEGVAIDLRGKTSLSQAATLMKNAFCHIGTEGGLVHLARAMGTKSIVLFGPTSSAFLGYPQNINLTASDCTGCWGATKDWYIYCPRGLKDPECMNSFQTNSVIAAVANLNQLSAQL